MQKSERVLFIIGWIGIGLCIVAGLFIHLGLLDFVHGMELCYFHRATGLYCPGCGMTRAVFELVEGHPLRSLGKNIGLLGFGGTYAAFMVGCIYQIIESRKLRRNKEGLAVEILQEKEILLIKRSRLYNKRLESALIVISGLFILQWFLKNLLLIFWNIDLLMK